MSNPIVTIKVGFQLTGADDNSEVFTYPVQVLQHKDGEITLYYSSNDEARNQANALTKDGVTALEQSANFVVFNTVGLQVFISQEFKSLPEIIKALRHARRGLQGLYPWPINGKHTQKEARDAALASVNEIAKAVGLNIE